MEKKPKIIGSFSEFGHIGYITKHDKFKKQLEDKTLKGIMIGYSKNHARYMYKLYNPETRRVLLTRYVKWVDWKMTNPTETLKMF